MKALQKYEPDKQHQNLPVPIAKLIAYAADHALINDLDVESIHPVVKVAVMRAKQLTGYKLTDPEVSLFISESERILMTYYRGLHISEITVLFNLWAEQHYGEWIGFTIQNWAWAAKKYYTDPMRLNSLNERKKEKKDKSTLLKLQEANKNRIAGVKMSLELFEKFKAGEPIYDLGNVVYDFLVQSKVIEPGFGNQFLIRAKNSVIKEHNPKYATSKKEFQQFKDLIAEVQDSIGSHSTVIAEAKRIALEEAFKFLINGDTDLKELLCGSSAKNEQPRTGNI